MEKDIREIDNEIMHVTQSVVVHTPKYSKFGGYEGQNDIYTMDIAKALYQKGYRKQKEGEWVRYSSSMMECTVCKRHTAYHRYEFCPNCGAKMKGQ